MKILASSLTQMLRKLDMCSFALISLLGMAMCCSIAIAQSGAGSIEGTVTDTTGAVVPGASIHVVNQATNFTAETKSSAVGYYQVPGLFTGTYAVTVTTPNMKTYKTMVDVQVGPSPSTTTQPEKRGGR